DKSSRQFQRNKAGRRRVLSQEIDDAKTVFHSSSRWDAIAKHDLLAGIMDPRLKIETAFTPRLANCPAGQATGYLLDVALRVTAINAKCVQFHQLTGVVFIEPPAAVVGAAHPRGRRVGIGAQPIVEIKEHRWTLRCGEQEIAKLTQGMGSNRVSVVSGGQPTIGSLRGKNVEVVAPKIHHDFIELSPAIDRAQ